jgi:hypothetical protein
MNEQELKAKALELAVQLCSYNSLQIAEARENNEQVGFVDLLEKTTMRYAETFKAYLSS